MLPCLTRIFFDPTGAVEIVVKMTGEEAAQTKGVGSDSEPFPNCLRQQNDMPNENMCFRGLRSSLDEIDQWRELSQSTSEK